MPSSGLWPPGTGTAVQAPVGTRAQQGRRWICLMSSSDVVAPGRSTPTDLLCCGRAFQRVVDRFRSYMHTMEEKLAFFKEHGYYIEHGALSPEEVATVNAAIQAVGG